MSRKLRSAMRTKSKQGYAIGLPPLGYKHDTVDLKKVVAEEKTHEMNCDGFLEMVRKYTNTTELTPDILSEFIDKIVVHHREDVFGETVQKVEIYYIILENKYRKRIKKMI